MRVGEGAYQQVVIPELSRISFPPQILSDGRATIVTWRVTLHVSLVTEGKGKEG